STLISIAIIIVCIFLILIVLVQNSKGGGLASSFSSSNQVMGVRKTADFLEKATWTLAIALLVLSLLSAAYDSPSDGTTTNKTESATRKVGENAATESTSPAGPAVLPTDTAK
ncbi:MAG: secG, partial [Bacteroidetes bacterium]|nr:secG [Bacteroidota bacterium]